MKTERRAGVQDDESASLGQWFLHAQKVTRGGDAPVLYGRGTWVKCKLFQAREMIWISLSCLQPNP